MLGTALLASLWFELGSWFGFSVAKFGSRDKNQNLLIEGYDARRALPIIDAHIAKQTLGATRVQRMAAERLAKGVRFLVNTKAFELVLLQKLHESWPGQVKPSPSEVRLIL